MGFEEAGALYGGRFLALLARTVAAGTEQACRLEARQSPSPRRVVGSLLPAFRRPRSTKLRRPSVVGPIGNSRSRSAPAPFDRGCSGGGIELWVPVGIGCRWPEPSPGRRS